MSIIQNIRDKAAWLVFGVIALSLLGFLLMDAFVGKSGRGLLGGNETTLGSVNGNKIEYIEYQKKVQQYENQYQQQGYPMNEAMRQNIQEQVWNQFVEENVLNAEYKKLGITVTPKELDDMLFGANPPQDIRQQFSDAQGNYDANAAKAAIANLRKQKDNAMAQNFSEVYLPALVDSRMREKYASLLGNTYYVPKWMAEKTIADNSQLAAVNFVAVPYSTVSDSAAEVKVSDADIEAYISKHKEEYKQEASRGISYVAFSAAPTAADTNALRTTLDNLRADFAAAPDPAAFLVRNNSELTFYDGYVVKSKLQVPNADTIRNLADGVVYGPYLDSRNIVIAKMIGKRTLADSVKCRHILISNQAVPDSIAEKRIDSIQAAIKGGADFAALALKYSDDQGSKDKGGEYSFSSQQFGTLAKEFAEFIFYGTTGEKKVVKTSFGYHYIEILNQKNFEQAYKVAYLSRAIIPSTETENAASGLANQFAGESRNQKAFDETVAKNKLTKLIATEIKPNDIMIPGLGSSRQLVRWINDAKIGEVSEPVNIEDKYVVAVLTEINAAGTMSVAKARPQVEFIIRNQKKAEQIRKKIGTAATLDAIATATQQTVQHTDSIKFSAPFIPNIGQEPKVIGAAFNKANQAKISVPIAGNGGVYVIQSTNVSAMADGGVNPDEQRNAQMQQMRQMSGFRSVESLRKGATVKDERAKIL
ncbi:SurA N-terminal domain-containing protein [Flavihumibacter fluvii]|uniref:SurA N-terminal domain-containing protein n=1 Tax=Flavihumibacter fluvii TaxID=2838157 RepID=UPI001BDEDFB8|nr:SurA N-terminal domain-containing protein [Flavihumibacter fluvii]ULQ51680.1 SurA N-terminal domain-containing protein [Flavihumibacter fluvii]